MVRLWLDDIRPAPDGWAWARTVEEAVSLLERGEVAEASLDHDLGEQGAEEGYRLVVWMAENGVWPSEGMAVHSSSNPPGTRRRCGVIKRYGPYRRVPGTTRRFVAPAGSGA